ncbi:MAG: hypothetical protein EXR99_03575 [Gemmataceae bacterium]|nr:hypothetical protein [Gemmataceae bacterium]
MRRNSQRPAYTLIEVGVVMALLGAVMVVVTTLLVGMVGLEGAESGLQARMQGLVRLGEQFRADGATAAKAKFTPGPDDKSASLTLEFAKGKPVTYQWEKAGLFREGPEGKQRLIPSSIIEQIEFAAGEKDRLVSMRLLEKGKGARSPLRNWWIQSALGGDVQ